MDVIVRQVLEYIQRQSSHKNAIVAGGSVRDQILGLTPKDYDIFVPVNSRRDTDHLVYSMDKDLGISSSNDITAYESALNPIKGVWNFTFEGKIFDVIGVQLQDDSDFPDEILKSFDYGINMAWDNGSYLEDQNKYFQYDLNNNTMTLVAVKGVEYLNDSIKRFNSFNQKLVANGLPERVFRSVCLKVEDQGSNDFDSMKLGQFPLALGGTGSTRRPWEPARAILTTNDMLDRQQTMAGWQEFTRAIERFDVPRDIIIPDAAPPFPDIETDNNF